MKDTVVQTTKWDANHSFRTSNSRGCSIRILKKRNYKLIDDLYDEMEDTLF